MSEKRHFLVLVFFFSSRRRHTRFDCDWSSDVCSSDLTAAAGGRPGKRVALPVGDGDDRVVEGSMHVRDRIEHVLARLLGLLGGRGRRRDRKSTRLNSSHSQISYAVFCLEKKTKCEPST